MSKQEDRETEGSLEAQKLHIGVLGGRVL